MVVYLDVIWLLNFLVDSLLIWMTAIFLKRNIHPVRIFAGGLIGSLLIILSVTPWSTFANHPISKIGISICMIIIAFGFKRVNYFFSGLMTLYFSTFLMGGILIGVHYFVNFDNEIQSTVLLQSIQGFGDPISWVFVIFGFPAAWHFSQRSMNRITISNLVYDVLVDVVVVINDIEFQIKGLVDSGNSLYDPISKVPVMIVQSTAVEGQLPKEILQLASNNSDHLDKVGQIPSQWASTMRLIPATTLGQKNQLLCAFKPDKITLLDNHSAKDVKKALVVFTDQVLSADGRFQCIIHPLMASDGIVQPAS
ncbi:sigma-E processing peptidase SpoIIGA [Bacillus sp. FSL K6-3431]|uniref:sigma-E processing peptidase SpoIIGA n=1 Tax=Bacillus sp. FSL K6-3431 TaxID=2921500 RepID=UPI0030FBD390